MDTAASQELQKETLINQETMVRSPRFLIIKRKDGNDFSKVSPFVIAKILYGLVGDLKQVKKIKDGLLVETVSAAQSKRLAKVDMFGEMQVEIVSHGSLNICKGVVYCPDLLNCTTEEIQCNLREQGVIDVKRIQAKRDGAFVDTPNHILTFDRPNLPSSIIVAKYLNLKIRHYIPQPLRCFRCQKFGHTSKNCTREPICFCGHPIHEGSPCEGSFICVNCQGPHAANDTNCPKLKEEKAIQELKVKERITYYEARKKIITSTPVQSVSYAKATQLIPKFNEDKIVAALLPKLSLLIQNLIQENLKAVEQSQSSIPLPDLPRSSDNLTPEPTKRKRDENVSYTEKSESEISNSSSRDTSRGDSKKPKKKGWPKGKPRKKMSNTSASSTDKIRQRSGEDEMITDD